MSEKPSWGTRTPVSSRCRCQDDRTSGGARLHHPTWLRLRVSAGAAPAPSWPQPRRGVEVAGPLGTPLGLAQRKRASPRGEAGTSGFLCVSDSDRRAQD